jgi:hypothetical protein
MIMKTILKAIFVFACCLVFASVAIGAEEQNKNKKPQPNKKPAHGGQVSQPAPKQKAVGKPTTTGRPAPGPTKAVRTTAHYERAKPGKPNAVERSMTTKPAEVGKAKGAAKMTNAGKPLKARHFDLAKQPNTAKAPRVNFQQGRRIQGSQNWQGQSYAVFRNYRAEWHDQGWWHSHHNRIVFVFGAPYYWNAGYWFPAWGYYPNAYYAWDGPIYGYNNLPPDQVIANVQSALQQQGYYHGEVDGLIGPLTRAAIADYQRDHGLYITSAIDEPTLSSLGMT